MERFWCVPSLGGIRESGSGPSSAIWQAKVLPKSQPFCLPLTGLPRRSWTAYGTSSSALYPSHQGEMCRAMARLAAQLEHALSSCPTVRFPAEHFDLAEVWTQARQSWSQLSLPLSPEDADWAVEQCLQITDRDAQVIHGDLGPWNLLFTPDRELLVIDFGQARMGDPYFDVASLLGGLVNHAPQERRAKACEEFLDECQLHMPLNLLSPCHIILL